MNKFKEELLSIQTQLASEQDRYFSRFAVGPLSGLYDTAIKRNKARKCSNVSHK